MWSSSGAKGSALEALIEYTNERLRKSGLARVDKVATPVKVVEFQSGMITKGFFEKPSTVDFVGIVQGVFVAFDAKETNLTNLPLKNIHPHQVEYMLDIEKQGGLAFLIVHFKKTDDYFLLPAKLIAKYIKGEFQGRKSIPYSEMIDCIEIQRDSRDQTLRYLEALNLYIRTK